ncbi:MAG TPA: hypothetical protein VE782_09045, partial [Myxococcaceae bacterium]|nr:hypothetical protein [Myxococcaceae bacterium]
MSSGVDGTSALGGLELERAPEAVQRSGRRGRTWLMWMALCAINCLLFAPSFAFHQGQQNFFPFFPAEHPHGAYRLDLRSGWEYAKAVAVRRENRDVFRISYEFGLFLAALALVSRTRGRAVLRLAGVLAYAVLLIFLIYDRAIPYFFQRTPALWEDWRLIINLVHYIGDVPSLGLSAIAVGAGGVLVVALVAIERLFA